MINNPKTAVDICPSCGTKIYFAEAPEASQIVTCPECRDVLEVVSLSPLRLAWADDHFDYDDDDGDDVWDDDNDDDYEVYDDDEDDYIEIDDDI